MASLIISIKENYLQKFDEIKNSIIEKGGEITCSMKNLGLISITCNDLNSIQSLKSIDGILSIEEEGVIQISPPNCDIQ